MSVRNVLTAVSLALSVLIGLVLARAGGASKGGAVGGGTAPLIGFSMDTLKEARWQADRDLFTQRARELGATVNVQSANGDDSQQVRDVESLLTAGVKALVVVPHDGQTMSKAVEMAHKVGVPVVAYDRIINNSDLDLYLSFDNERVGSLQAQYLVDKLKGKGRLIRIYGAPTDNNAKQFKAGQDKVLEPYLKSGAIKVLREDWAADWKPENAKRIMNAAITAIGPNFDGVLASNDGTAGGAIQALREAGLAGKIPVTGQDADLAACQRIAAGSQAMTIYKPIKVLAGSAAEAAVKLAKGQPLIATRTVNNGKVDVPSILNDVYVVTKENLLTTVIKDGFHSYDEVFSDVPAGQRPAKP